MKFRSEIESRLSLRLAKRQLRRRFRTLSPLPKGEGISQRRLCLNGRKQVRVALGLRRPRRQRKPRLQRRSDGGRYSRRPAAKRIAREKGIDLAPLTWERSGGSDLSRRCCSGCDSRNIATTSGHPKSKKQSSSRPMRRIVGERMTKSKQTAPHFYLSMDSDMTEVTRRRKPEGKSGESIVPSINDFILQRVRSSVEEIFRHSTRPSRTKELRFIRHQYRHGRGAGRRLGGAGDPQRRSTDACKSWPNRAVS